MIQKLYTENRSLHKELTKQEKFEKRLNYVVYDVSCDYNKIINHLEKENRNLHKMIDKFKKTLKKFNGFVTSFLIHLRIKLYDILRKKHILTLILKNNLI